MTDEQLCHEIERVAVRQMKEPKDFEWLARQISDAMHTAIGVNTLKRLWGYYGDNIATRRSTLDVLAQYVGYADYTTFARARHTADPEQSHDVLSRHLETTRIDKGTRVRVRWQPDRVCMFEYLGEGRFVVRSVENSKLSVGDTFACHLIIEGEPLYLANLVHEGMSPVAYVAGIDGGVHFELVE